MTTGQLDETPPKSPSPLHWSHPDAPRDEGAKLTRDALIEDMFGINLQGLRTTWLACVDPARIARRARLPDWGGRITPTFRLYFFYVALATFFQFLWARPGGSYEAILLAQIEPVIADFDINGDVATFTRSYIKTNFALLPFLTSAFCLLLAAVWRMTELKTSFIVKQRLVFLTLLPISAIAVLLYLPIAIINEGNLAAYLAGITLLSFTVTGLTAYKGVFTWGSRFARVMRTFAYLLGYMVTVLLAATLAQFLSAMVTMMRLG